MLAALGGGEVEAPTIMSVDLTPEPSSRRKGRSAWPIIIGGLAAVLLVGAVVLFALLPNAVPAPTPTEPSIVVAAVTESLMPTATYSPEPEDTATSSLMASRHSFTSPSETGR